MVKKYIGKVNSSKFRRKNSNTGKKSRKGRKGRKTIKKRRILMGNVNTRVHLTTGTIGGVHINLNDNQRKEIIKLLNNIPVDNKYLLHRPTEMFSKIFHPVFLTQKGEILELKSNIAYESIDSLRLQVADNIYPLKPLQRQQINKLMELN